MHKNNIEFEYKSNKDKKTLYRIAGQYLYTFYNRKKLLNNNSENIHIKNNYNRLIIVEVIIVLCISLIIAIESNISTGIATFIISIMLISFILYIKIKKENKALMSNDNKNIKIIISDEGLKVIINVEIFIKWTEIEMIIKTNDAIMITMKNSKQIMILAPREDILEEIRKHTKAKVIIDK